MKMIYRSFKSRNLFLCLSAISIALFAGGVVIGQPPSYDSATEIEEQDQIAGPASELIYGVTQPNSQEVPGVNLVSFLSTSPGTVTTIGPFTGVVSGHGLRSIDFRPSSGVLYAISTNGSAAQLYTVNLTNAALTPVGTGFTLGNNTFISVDIEFNPVVDLIRVVTAASAASAQTNNFRLDPNTGTLVNTDTNLAFDPSDSQTGDTAFNVVATAYSNNVVGASQTTLYAWDYNEDGLLTIGGLNGTPSPNSGLMFTVNNPVSFLTFSAGIGMDISGATGILYVTHDDPASGTSMQLYTRNVTTGAQTLVGGYPAGTFIADISVAPAGGATPTPTASPTATASATPPPATATPSATIVPSATPSASPSATAGCTPATVSYTGAPVAIPDNNTTGVNLVVAVAGLSSITDLDFRFDGTVSSPDPLSTTVGVNHSWVGDMIFRLTSPGGTTVTFYDRPGVPASTFGCSSNNLFALTLDDEAGSALEGQCPGGTDAGPLTGSFTPNNPLSAFDGQNPNGNWTLTAIDAAGGDVGTVRAFSLIFGGACGTPSTTPTPTPSLTVSPTCPPVITHSTSQAITPLNSVSCNNGVGHTDNSYWRAFNMGTFAGGAQYNVTSVSFGVEEATGAGGTQPVTVRLYTTTNFPVGFPGSLTQIATTTIQVPDAASGTVLSVPLVATVPAGTSELVMELFTPDGQAAGNLFFVGSNAAAETGPSYLSATACGITTPTTTAAIGFPNMHIVFNVLGGCSPPPSPPPPSPTVTPSTPTPTPTVTPSTPTPTPTITPPAETPTPSPSATPGTPPPAQAVNFSTRMFVRTGDQVGIGGFIVVGSGPKNVIVRAIGPTLARNGILDFLADPVLELHGPTGFATIINNNWRDTQEDEIQATGIPPTNDLESAIVASLAPGNYTAVVRGNGNTIGTALVEVYDLDLAATSKLGNISTRAFVSTGDDIVIAGFILGNNAGDDNVIVRGLGPSLSASGVPTVLADPTLELRDNNGALLLANNDWQDNAAQAAIISAAGLAPGNAQESAIAATLPPGLYTALLAGINKTTGNGLVEVYDRGVGGTLFTATLEGAQQVPPNASTATGSGTVLLNDAETTITVNLSFDGLADPATMAHIHGPAAPGANAPVIFDFTGVPNATSGSIPEQTFAITPAQVADLRNSLHYFNIHNASFPSGEIRGQIGGVAPVPTPSPTPPGSTPSPTPPGATPSPTPPGATPTPSPIAEPCFETFDASSSLPSGWVATNDQGPPPLWAISTTSSDTLPNNAFVPDTAVISDKRLDSSPYNIVSAAAQISFRNNYDFEFSDGTYWDGGVLEVSINGGPFVDVTDPSVGGVFVSGAYNGTVDATADNPIMSQPAWGSSSGGYINSVINLGAALQGQTIVLRFRMGTDQAIGAPGWHVDTLVVTGALCQ